MKKHLIAAAVAAAVATPAMAQVTVYGRLDVGYSSFKTNATTGDHSGIGYNADSTSRFGLRGSEDLGKGLKASFVLEGAAAGGTLMNNTVSAATGAANSFSGFARAQFLALEGSFGEVRLGLSNTMTKNIVDGYNAGGASGIEGKLSDTIGAAGAAGRDNAVTYTSPSLNGFKVAVAATSLKDDGDATASGSEIGLTYAAGPFNAAVAARNVKNSTVFKTKHSTVGATYNLGIATLTSVYTSVEKGAASVIKDESFEIGARVPLGSAAAFVSFANGDSQTGTNAALDVSAQQVGVRYNMSKRTYAYAITGKSKIATSSTASTTESNTGIGLVHSF